MCCFSKISIIIVKYDFKSKSCFSGVFGNPLLAVVGELGSDVAKMSWFLLLRFLHFPLAILLSVIIGDLVVSDWSLPLMWILGPVGSGRKLLLSVQLCVDVQCVLVAGTQLSLWAQVGSSCEAVLGAQPFAHQS